MLRTFLRGLLFVFGIIFIICGIHSIFIVAIGGSISIPSITPRISTDSHVYEYSGAGGIFMSVLLTLLGVWMVSEVKSKKTGKNTDGKESAKPPVCVWWKLEEEWHYEHNPLSRVEYPESNRCPLCKKEISIIDVYK